MTTFKLKAPVRHGGVIIDELEFRPLQFGDLEALHSATSMMNAVAILLSRTSGQPIDVIRSLDIEDMAAIQSELGDGLESNLKRFLN